MGRRLAPCKLLLRYTSLLQESVQALLVTALDQETPTRTTETVSSLLNTQQTKKSYFELA